MVLGLYKQRPFVSVVLVLLISIWGVIYLQDLRFYRSHEPSIKAPSPPIHLEQYAWQDEFKDDIPPKPDHSMYPGFDNEATEVSFPTGELRYKFGTSEVWRSVSRYPFRDNRVVEPVVGSLVRPLSNDILHPLCNDMFLMFKTGADIMWRRTPAHLHTTLTRFPHFALYSDRPGMIAGYEVIDILAGMPRDVLNSHELIKYRIMRQMQDEAWMWGAEDISMAEGWNMDRFKNVPMMLHAYKNAPPNTKWFIMIDDDTHILSSNIAKYLSTLESSHPYYIGSAAQAGSYTFAHGGSGVIFSRGALDKLFGPDAAKPQDELMDEYARKALYVSPFGDLMASLILSEKANVFVNTEDKNADKAKLDMFKHGRDMFQGETVSSTWLNVYNWCYPLGTFHHERPQELELLWEWEQTRAKNSDYLTYYDLYRDFILPYIAEEVPDWLIPGGIVLNAEKTAETPEMYKGKQIWPNSTQEHCKLACMSREDCLSWSFKYSECHVHEKGLIKGAAARIHDASADKDTWISGFLIDRIRKIRSEQRCDPLKELPLGSYNDSPDTSEGWYYRKLEEEEDRPQRTPY